MSKTYNVRKSQQDPCERQNAILVSLSFCQKSGIEMLLSFFQNYSQHMLMERDKDYGEAIQHGGYDSKRIKLQ